MRNLEYQASRYGCEKREYWMFLRVLYLVALIGLVGGGAAPTDTDDDESGRMGGEGFGNVVMLVAVLGVLVLGAIVAVAILALMGQFENTAVDPPV